MHVASKNIGYLTLNKKIVSYQIVCGETLHWHHVKCTLMDWILQKSEKICPLIGIDLFDADDPNPVDLLNHG